MLLVKYQSSQTDFSRVTNWEKTIAVKPLMLEEKRTMSKEAREPVAYLESMATPSGLSDLYDLNRGALGRVEVLWEEPRRVIT